MRRLFRAVGLPIRFLAEATAGAAATREQAEAFLATGWQRLNTR
jgi:hypothetical protein